MITANEYLNFLYDIAVIYTVKRVQTWVEPQNIIKHLLLFSTVAKPQLNRTIVGNFRTEIEEQISLTSLKHLRYVLVQERDIQLETIHTSANRIHTST